MPYQVYTRTGPGAFGVIVETAREALGKATQLADEGHPQVLIKDLLGNIITLAALTALVADEDG